MAKHTPGNGSSKFPVHQQDMGGWVRVFTDKTATVPDDFPVFLSLALTEWFRQRPQLRLRTVVPICRNGNTVELHAWFELHVFPDPSRPPPGG
jgi:hypothetical protein